MLSERVEQCSGSYMGMSDTERSGGELLKERFRCSEDVAAFEVSGDLPRETGYFRLGPDAICYGRC